ncbi:MAG TPA: hypothetical protein VG347_01690 [Verrucomicrobiae bacterium]|nr:hypothetical protein [Verrucomicrobiae bacterium]
MSSESDNAKTPVSRFIFSPMRVIDWIDAHPSETFRRVCHGLLVLAIAFAINRIYVNWHVVTDAVASGSQVVQKIVVSKIPAWTSLLVALVAVAFQWLSIRKAKVVELKLIEAEFAKNKALKALFDETSQPAKAAKLTCTNCKNVFFLKKKLERHIDAVGEVYVRCPRCKMMVLTDQK